MAVLEAQELEGLLDHLAAVLWTADPQTLDLLSVSGGGLARIGHAPTEWLQPMFLAAHLSADERSVTLAQCRAVAADGRARSFVHRFRCADGSERWMRTHVRRRPSNGGFVLIGVTQDITDVDLLGPEPPPIQPSPESWTQLLLDQLPAIIWTTDRELRFTGSAGAGLALIGVRPNQLRGLHIAEYFRVDDPAHPYLAAHQQALAGETARLDAEWIGRHYRIRIEPFRKEGQIVGTLGIAHDDTERVQAERARSEALAVSESKRRLLAAIIDHAPFGVVLLRGPEFVIERINPFWQAVVPGKAMVSKPVFATWPETEAELRPLLEHGYRTNAICSDLDHRFHVQRRPDGPLEELYFSFVFVPMRDLPELPDAMLLLAVETTDRVHAHRQIEALAADAQRHAAELRSVLDHIVEGVYVCDREGRVVIMNEAACRQFDLPDASQEIGQPIGRAGFYHPNGRPYAYDERPIVRALHGEIVGIDHVLIPRPDRPRHYMVTAAPIRDAGGSILGAVSVARDVTDRMEFEELKDQFLRVVAHELKTPVAIMKANAQLLLGYALTEERRRASLDSIVRGADRIDRIVRDVLDMALFHLGLVTLAAEPLELLEVAQAEVARAIAGAPDRRITITHAEPARVRGDRSRLAQAIRILVDNALRYSPGGGPVELEVTTRDGEALLTVRDRGIGIPKAKQQHLYERFYRAHTDGPYDFGGLGVGLYISREIVLRHHGRVWLESTENLGSAFHFALPLEPPRGG